MPRKRAELTHVEVNVYKGGKLGKLWIDKNWIKWLKWDPKTKKEQIHTKKWKDFVAWIAK